MNTHRRLHAGRVSRSVTPVLLTLVVAFMTGCAGASQQSGQRSPDARATQLRNQQEMTAEEIRSTQYTNMFDVIQALRGNWLRRKGDISLTGTQAQIQVYIDNQRVGGPEELRTLVPINVALVRYYDPQAASSRWGLDHTQGAIYVLSARR
jgi:hypothetical protein